MLSTKWKTTAVKEVIGSLSLRTFVEALYIHQTLPNHQPGLRTDCKLCVVPPAHLWLTHPIYANISHFESPSPSPCTHKLFTTSIPVRPSHHTLIHVMIMYLYSIHSSFITKLLCTSPIPVPTSPLPLLEFRLHLWFVITDEDPLKSSYNVVSVSYKCTWGQRQVKSCRIDQLRTTDSEIAPTNKCLGASHFTKISCL